MNDNYNIMRFIFLIGLILVSLHFKAFSQEILNSGIITFEKKINVHKDVEGTIGEQFKSTLPRYQLTYMSLSFDTKHSLFQKASELQEKIPFIFDENSIEDKIWTDLNSKRVIKQQHIFQDIYSISDSCIEYKWKITNESRNIAGFDCYRAETIIHDSVYIIAFFTDKIEVSGGPLYFRGLPGMILGIVAPRLNITLFATKFESLDNTTFSIPNLSGTPKMIKHHEFRSKLYDFASSNKGFPMSVYLRWLL